MAEVAFDSCVFSTAFAIDALTYASNAGANAEHAIAKAVQFLEAEMEFGGVWRYWSTRNHRHSRLPPDLDDTACSSYALKRAGRSVPDNAWIFRCSRDPMGRFRTWVLPTPSNRSNLRFLLARSIGGVQARIRNPTVPKVEDPRFRIMHIDRDDIDPVVNANVVLYMGERPETLAAIEFIIATVRKEPARLSLYYDRLAFYHAIARAFRHASPRLGGLSGEIAARTIELAGTPASLNPLQVAMAASVLLTFMPVSNLIADLLRQILHTQRGDGGWELCAFYSKVWGSRELTTGFCLEALGLAQDRQHPDG